MILISLVYIFFIFYRPKRRKWVFINRRLVIGGILAIIIFSLFYGYFHTKIPMVFEFGPEILEEQTTIVAIGRAAYLEGMKVESCFDIIWQTPVRIFYFYFTPFLWQLKEWLDVVGFVDVLLYLFLFIFCFKSLNQIRKENKRRFFRSAFNFCCVLCHFCLGGSLIMALLCGIDTKE